MSFNGVETENLHEVAAPSRIGMAYDHPAELLEDPGVDKDVKRTLLASWASDSRAIKGSPSLRRLDNGAVVRIDDILSALSELDRSRVAVAPPMPSRPAFRLLRRPLPIRLSRTRRDDDPPNRPIRLKLANGFGG